MIEIECQNELEQLLSANSNIAYYAFQGLDLKRFEGGFSNKKVEHCLFLSCDISLSLQQKLLAENNIIIPRFDVPFMSSVSSLYTKEILYNDYDYRKPDSYYSTYDKIVYEHYLKTGKGNPDTIYEALARRLHDHSITDALMDILKEKDSNKVIAIMGGHSLSRKDEDFKKIAKLAKAFVEKGYFLLSGGGPGAMEATHLGVWFAENESIELDKAFNILEKAPTYDHENWLSSAFEVIEKFPRKVDYKRDIGIPTWLYGHEPPTPFASQIAKYFANSVREEGLLALAKGGVVFAPGSAGTIQEIFQDAAQNHYKSYEMASPMIFLNSHYWEIEKPVYPLLVDLAKGNEYASMLHIFNEVDEIIGYMETLT